MQPLYAEQALLPDGWARRVRLTLDCSGIIRQIERNAAPHGARRLPGPAIPGMANAHSHAFQRLLAGLTEVADCPDDNFWTWREALYRVANRLSPEQLETVTRYAYLEMLRGGYTSVAEFHYLHHQPDGHAYANREELGECILAAADVGIRLTLLPVLYTYSDFGGQAPAPAQRRFINDVAGYLSLYDALNRAIGEHSLVVLGPAFHSLRAVTQIQVRSVLEALPQTEIIHMHIAEQRREVEACRAWSGQRPVEWLLERFALDERWCLIHATHVNAAECTRLAWQGTIVGLCPTTEANLGDGVFPAEAFLQAGGRFGIGSDSQVSISVTEELRWLEYGQRLRAERRNRLWSPAQRSVGENLYARAADGGSRAIGQPVGTIALGRGADLIVLDADHPMLAGCPPEHLLNRWLFAGDKQLIREVWVAGTRALSDGHHPREREITAAFRRVARQLLNG
ncbi:formimidoylglutamate deiminase [Nitrococcus mobilis]|uniref:Atrazine chlorohydrolase n=1 Tax=Nitrococcus mobilis Nb-231 TaxID=314278 RepID=A4BTA7_9GAMM|nr:formimidoylglutamate deiminase [Nitrococcus mobilis]EAR21009.1 atrazine chlorohydrolase [Nitrococcus mobilis Nb-231]